MAGEGRDGRRVICLERSLEAGIELLCARLAALIEGSAPAEVICDLRAVQEADLSLVGVLARLTLTARRAGGRLLLRNVGEALGDLIELSGLACVLDLEPASAGEFERQPEKWEQTLRVQKEADAGDAFA